MPTDRVDQSCYLSETLSHSCDSLLAESKPVEKRSADAFSGGLFDIGSIRFEQHRRTSRDSFCHLDQSGATVRSGRGGSIREACRANRPITSIIEKAYPEWKYDRFELISRLYSLSNKNDHLVTMYHHTSRLKRVSSDRLSSLGSRHRNQALRHYPVVRPEHFHRGSLAKTAFNRDETHRQQRSAPVDDGAYRPIIDMDGPLGWLAESDPKFTSRQSRLVGCQPRSNIRAANSSSDHIILASICNDNGDA